MKYLLLAALAALLNGNLVLPAPAPTKTTTTAPPPEELSEIPPDAESVDPPNTGLYYDQYLQKVVQLLESNEDFRKSMEQANFEDIKSGKMSDELLKIPGEIRNELDALKREEMTRLRRIVHAKSELEKGRRMSQPQHMKEIAQHLDAENPHTFETQDLTNLIKAATKDLENYDAKRHEEFKKYEMSKELRRQEKLRKMSEEDRRRAEEEFQQKRKRHEEHEAVNHPGSKAQLEEVWNEEDGLKGQEFNPKTFFNMHDINGDGYLDTAELEAIFEKDLQKVYNEDNPDDDMLEMEEERTRMRQHVMKEVDTNKDGLISMEEFLNYSKTKEFENPDKESYKTVDEMIDDNDLFTDEEFQEFKKYIEEQEKEIKEKLGQLREKARSVVGKRNELNSNVQNLKAQNVDVDNHPVIAEKKEEIAQEEKEMKEMHEELRKQSQEIMELKKEVAKQEDLKNPEAAAARKEEAQRNKVPVEEIHRQYVEKTGKVYQQQAGAGGQPPPNVQGQYQQGQGQGQYQQPPQGGQQPPPGQGQYQQPPQGGQQPPQGGQHYQQGQEQYQQQPQGGQQPPQGQGQQFQQDQQQQQQFQQQQQGGQQQHQQPPQGQEQYNQQQQQQQFRQVDQQQQQGQQNL